MCLAILTSNASDATHQILIREYDIQGANLTYKGTYLPQDFINKIVLEDKYQINVYYSGKNFSINWNISSEVA